MKRIFTVIAFVAAVFTVGAQSLKDGVYFAQEKEFPKTGWKAQVVLEVKGGKIVKAVWNEVNNIGKEDLKTVSAAGGYGMGKASKIKKEWHEQAAAVEAYLVKTQDVNFNKYKNAAGETDAITGASLSVKGFFSLAKEALASAPVPKGAYTKDGWYYASAASFDKSGWKDNVLITVANGSVVDALWNGISSDKKKKSKLQESMAGSYGMGKAAKQGEWHEQAARAEAALVKTQNPAAIAVRSDGKTDAITGVTIGVSEFLTLADTALKAAR